MSYKVSDYLTCNNYSYVIVHILDDPHGDVHHCHHQHHAVRLTIGAYLGCESHQCFRSFTAIFYLELRPVWQVLLAEHHEVQHLFKATTPE